MPLSETDHNIGRLLSRAAREHGSKRLLHFHDRDRSFSFEELDRSVNRFAGALKSAGVSRGDHVALMMNNRPEFFQTWLALARLGAVAVPLNTRYRAEDLIYTLTDSDAGCLITENEFAELFSRVEAKLPTLKTVFSVDDDPSASLPSLVPLIRAAGEDFSGPEVGLQDLMSIQYTSGTTGFPKGCLLSHQYWLTIGRTLAGQMEPGDVFLCVEPFYYMDPPWELTMCLLMGMPMVIAERYSPSRYMDLVRRYGVTVSWALLTAWIYKQPPHPDDRNHHLRLLLSGAIPKDIHRPFEGRFNVPLREGYGMTEIGAGIFMPLADAHMSGSGSVGKPVANREVKVVDDHGRAVPEGGEGELWISGPGLFNGYYKKPEATAEVFEGRWFKTGDLVRQDEQGYFYIIGRKKEMIKRSGDNISVAEVENVLISHPGILAAAVIGVPDPDRKEEVKAYVVKARGKQWHTLGPEEIITFCQERLADFKVPRYLELRDQDFPRTPTGKIIKRGLLREKQDLTADCYDRLAQSGRA